MSHLELPRLETIQKYTVKVELQPVTQKRGKVLTPEQIAKKKRQQYLWNKRWREKHPDKCTAYRLKFRARNKAAGLTSDGLPRSYKNRPELKGLTGRAYREAWRKLPENGK